MNTNEPATSEATVIAPGETGGDDDFFKTARKRFDDICEDEGDNRKAGLEDLKFKAGEQWPASIKAERENDARPCLTVNKMKTFVHQVTNAQRENRPAIFVNPIGDKADVNTAKMLRGMIRHIERRCDAEIAYDTAFDGAASNGWGYWRILTQYQAADSFNQEVAIQRIKNPFTVYMGPCNDPCGADAPYCFVTEMVGRDDFKRQWPDVVPMDWDATSIGEDYRNWVTETHIRVAEYYVVETRKRRLIALRNGFVGFWDELAPEVKDSLVDDKKLPEDQRQIVNDREAEDRTVKCYKIDAKNILESYDWLGKWIPIVRVIGDEVDIEGHTVLSGIIRDAKDSQRMYNYWVPLALTTPIPTLNGWKTMGDLGAGDFVFDEQGKPTEVVGTSPVHINRDCYRVTFDDGSSIVADGVHPWQVEERGKRAAQTWKWATKTVTTLDLAPDKHFIVGGKSLDLPDADLPISPYLLGAWLGDGSSAEPLICGNDEDLKEIRHYVLADGDVAGEIRKYPERVGMFTTHCVRRKFTALGLLGNKHIPPAYLRASRAQRERLLQGLMDTDGTITEAKQCGFTTASKRLASDFIELVRSLGIKATYCKRAAKVAKFAGYESVCQENYQFSFSCGPDDQPFRLRRKLQRMGVRFQTRRTKRFAIRSVEQVASVPVKCIKVASESHLFLAGPAMVPTHNTSETEMIALAPKAPFVMAEGQEEGHEMRWKQANRKLFPYLLYKQTDAAGKPAPPPRREPMPQIPAGMVNAKLGAAQDMMATTGIRFDATKSERVADESGIALAHLRQNTDLGAYHYIDNLGRALRHTGRQIIDLIPKVYDTQQVITILREDDSEERVKINPKQQSAYESDQHNGKPIKSFNPSVGTYDVTVTIGPNYATKRMEASDSMMNFAKAFPNKADFVADLVAKNQDWEGADVIAQRLAMTLPPEMLQPDDSDLSPQVQALIRAQQMQIKKLTEGAQQLGQALQSRDLEHAREIYKIETEHEDRERSTDVDYETKMAKTMADMEGKLLDHVGARFTEMMTLVKASLPPEEDVPEPGEAPQMGGPGGPGMMPGPGVAMGPASPGMAPPPGALPMQ